MLETKELVALRDEINVAIKTSRRLDRCHQQFLARRKGGITRARQTSYAAQSASLAASLKAEVNGVKQTACTVLNLVRG